jgi:hypothetical protein
LPLLLCPPGEPAEYTAFAGVLVLSAKSLFSIRLSSFPAPPALVPKMTVPPLVDVFALLRTTYRTVLSCASFTRRRAEPAAWLLLMVSSLAVPAPPGRPSSTTCAAPSSWMVAPAVALEMLRPVAAADGTMVILFVALDPDTGPNTTGKVSPALVYPG